MSLVGPSGCGKTQLIFEWLSKGTFQPEFDRIIFFFQHYQYLYKKLTKKFQNLTFIEGVDFDYVRTLPNNGSKYLLIFDDSLEDLTKSKDFVKLATAGRHRNLSVIYIKHNLFHKSPLGRDVELQNTHIVLFKSPRDVNQVNVLSKQLGLGKQLVEWYKSATAEPYGHLMIDLSPHTVDQLRYVSRTDQAPSLFFLAKHQRKVTILDDERTKRIYSQAISDLFPTDSGKIYNNMSKRDNSATKRVYPESKNGKDTKDKKKRCGDVRL